MLSFFKKNILFCYIEQYLELLKTSQNRPAQCLSILWVLGQCGITDLRCGLRGNLRQNRSVPYVYIRDDKRSQQVIVKHKSMRIRKKAFQAGGV